MKIASCAAGLGLVFGAVLVEFGLGAGHGGPWLCSKVNASAVSDFCASTVKPLRVCVDAAGYDYHKTPAGYKKQAKACATAKSRKKQCSNEPSACVALASSYS